MTEQQLILDIPAEHAQNVFGGLDIYLKKIERTLHVDVVPRDGSIKIMGELEKINQAKQVFMQLVELS